MICTDGGSWRIPIFVSCWQAMANAAIAQMPQWVEMEDVGLAMVSPVVVVLTLLYVRTGAAARAEGLNLQNSPTFFGPHRFVGLFRP